WSFQPEAVDPDHEGGEIRIVPLRLPKGMIYDSTARNFHWTPPPAAAGHESELALRLEDPEGGMTESRFPIKIIAATSNFVTEGVKLSLPWDTLQQGKVYFWESNASAVGWSQQGITLESVS